MQKTSGTPGAGRALGLSLFLCVCTDVYADETPIVVTATRTAQIADEAVAPVTVITRDQIELSGANDAAELLQLYAGLELGRSGGPGQQTSLFTRGTESNHTLVLIDGLRINPGTIGTPALQYIEPELIERIEVVRGPRSALYGSDAIGGIVNIITRRPTKGRSGVDVGAGAGRYDTETTNLKAYYAGRFDADLALAMQRSDGFPTLAGTTLARGHDINSITAHLTADAGPVGLELNHWQVRGTTEYLDFSLLPVDQDFDNRATSLLARRTFNPRWDSSLQLGFMQDELSQNQTADLARTRRRTLDWQNDITPDDHQRVTAGVWLSRESTDAAGATLFDVHTDVDAVYLQDALTLTDHQLILAARYTDHETAGEETTWNIDYAYHWDARTRMTLSAGTGFRAPDSTDRFGFGGNPNLRPESSKSYEAALRHHWRASRNVVLRLFDTRIEDLIEYDFVSSSMQNIGRVRIRGAEFEYGLSAGRWRWQLAGTWQDPRNEDTEERLLRRSPRAARATLSYVQPRWSAATHLRASDRRHDVDPASFLPTETDGYGIVDIVARAELPGGWRLRGSVENVFDKDYELAAGYNSPRRSLFLELAYGVEYGS